MTLHSRFTIRIAVMATGLSLAGTLASAQTPHDPQNATHGGFYPHQPFALQQPSAQAPDLAAKPSAGVPVAIPASRTGARSMLDEPAAAAKIQVTGGQLSIEAANASLSEVIRQVAARTGMQVEGNSRDERVFGVYGPGNPEDVLSSLLYDSGYNVIMVGSTADGAPRKLVLSNRTAATAAQVASAQAVRHDDDDDEAPAEPAPPPPPPQPVSGSQITPANPGQPKTPQQMLEELQRMHQGEQPQEMPRPQQ